jgi:hypothetical protein
MNKLNEDIKRIKNLMNLSEMDGLEDYFTQDYTGQQGPHDEDNMAPDGMDDDSDKEEDVAESEISEEGEATTTSSGGGASAGYPTVTRWDSGVQRGKGNPVDSKKKWESGITRGKGNTLL